MTEGRGSKRQDRECAKWKASGPTSRSASRGFKQGTIKYTYLVCTWNLGWGSSQF